MHVTRRGRPGGGRSPGDPEHPITVGFLCGKVSNYLDRVYSDERILHPLVREGGELPAGVLGRGARPRGRRAARGRETSSAASRSCPTRYMGTQGLIQGNTMSARVMNALGATALERTICATAGIAGTRDDARPLARGRPRGVAARALRARLGLEPDVHRAAPLAQAARRAQGRRPARGGRPVPQPHRAGGRRAPAPAAGHRRRAGDRDDARDRRRRPPGRGLVPRPRRRLRRAARALAEHHRRALRRDLRRATRRRSRGSGASSPPRRPALLRLGVGAQRHAGRARGLLDARLAARAHRRVARPRRRLLLHPHGHRGGGQRGTAPARGPASRPGAHDQHVPARRARSPTPRLDPPVKAFVCWNSNPAAIAPDQERVLEGLRRDDLFTSCSSSS